MRLIMDYFKKETESSPYVFPIINPCACSHRTAYESGLTRQNRLLKDAGRLAGMDGGALTTHAARHTWATTAKRMGYGIAIISEGLGHRDTKVTAHYLASFERSALDELSVRISKFVKAA